MASERMQKNQYMLLSGAKIGAAQTALLLIIYISGNLFVSGWSGLSWLIYGWLIYIFLKKYRDEHLDGVLSYGRGILFGVRVSMYAGVIIGSFYFLLFQVIDPSLRDILIAQTEEAWLAAGMSETYVEKMQDGIQQMTNSWTYFMASILDAMFAGLIVSLIISAFTKRKGDPFKEAMRDV